MNSLSFNSKSNIQKQNVTFKGYDESFSKEKLKSKELIRAVEYSTKEMKACKYVDLAMSENNDICIKPKVQFSLTPAKGTPYYATKAGDPIFVHALTMSDMKLQGDTLMIPVGVGKHRYANRQILKLNFGDKALAQKVYESFKRGIMDYDAHAPKLAYLMDLSVKCARKTTEFINDAMIDVLKLTKQARF